MSVRFRTLVAAVAPLTATVASAQAPRSTSTPAANARAVGRTSSAPMMASIDTTLLRGLRYRHVGPPRGGRVTTVTGVPSQPRTFYFGAASGGLFKTTDAGATWVPITDGKVPVGSTGSVAVAESDPNIIYLGTGSDGLRSNVSTGRGVYKTTDGGETWSFVGLYDAGQIGAVRIHPKDPNTVWVAAVGNAFAPNRERGVFKTTDGGKTWKQVLFLSDSVGAADLELNPANPNVVYVWMARAERKPWTIISGAEDAVNGSFFKSTDGGETFKKITNGLPTGLVGKGNLAVTAANPNRVYALVEAKPGGGLYRSDDQGESWKLVNSTPGLVQRPFYYTTIGADPTNADIVYAGAETFYKSTDGGVTLTPMRTPHTDNHDIWINPTNGQIMIQANDGGANVSFDGGRTWSTQSNQPTAEIYGVWMDDQFPYRIYGAQQDASTVILPSYPFPGQTAPFESGPGCETGPIMPHPKNPQVVYGACKGQFGRMFMNTRAEQAYWIGAQSLYGNDAKDLILRFQRVAPMETSPFDTSVVYYGSQYVHRSRDGGVHWEKISPDLTWNPPGPSQGGSGEPITRDVTGEEFYSTLYAITASKLEPGVIWTGANDGPIHVTRDNGKTWKNVTPKDLPPGGRVQWIEASPHRKGSAYAAIYRYLLGDFQPYIYKTDDYGATWKRLTDGTNGIPKDWPTRVVREDPDREGLLYAGTEFGMFISADNGAHWQPFNQNMPQVPITDIRRHQKDLIVSTQGRGIWIMDDVTPLAQIGTQMASAATLFKPRDAIRGRLGGGRGAFGGGAGAGATSGQPEFPPYGATVNYYLPAPPSGPVTLEILDAANKVLRSFSSEAPARPVAQAARPAADPDDDENPAPRRGGGAAPVRLTTTAGINRVIWDFNDSNGLAVPPGSYKVRLTVDGKTQTQPLTLTMDPRLAEHGVKAADLVEQYAHNLKMRAMVTEANRVAAQIRTARTNAEKQNAPNLAEIRELGVAMFGKGEGIRYGQPGLLAQITYLAGMTARVDQRIGQDAIDRAVVLRKELDALEARVAKVLGVQP